MYLHKMFLLPMVRTVDVDSTILVCTLSISLCFVDAPSSLSESDIELLVSMGFSREQAQQALRESRGNVELAANRLLESI